MSIQALYYLVQGPQHLYGLTFGSYDLAAVVFAPLFGLWVDRTMKFKSSTLLGVILNAVGNFIYAFTVLAGKWYLMIISRLIAGAGSAVLGTGGTYITHTSSMQTRQAKMGRFRITQNIGRSVGPLVGFLFLGLPSPKYGSSDAIKVFNWYTIPGWLAGVVLTLLCLYFAWAFVDPTEENEHVVEPGNVPVTTSNARRRQFHVFFFSWTALAGLMAMLVMAQFSNFFALMAGQYHQIWEQSDTWRAFVGAGAGSIGGAMVYRRGMHIMPHIFNERVIVVVGNACLVVAFLLLVPYKGADWVPPPALFYTGSAFLGAGFTTSMACIETFLSKKVTQYADVVGDNVGKYMSILYTALSAGRFAGPLIVAAITRISTPNGDTFVCTTGWIVEPDGDVTCNGPPELQCGITASDYYIGGCVLLNAQPVYAAMAGIMGVVVIAIFFVLRANWSYKN